MAQLINIPAVFIKQPTETIDVKKYNAHPANNYSKPLYRYAKNYSVVGLDYSLIMLTESSDKVMVEKFLDTTAKTIVRKDIVTAQNNDNKMEYTNSKFGGNK